MNERLVEKVARAIYDEMDLSDSLALPEATRYAGAAIDASGLSALICAATEFVKEAEEMGFGKTSDRALPGSYDNLLAALKEVKG